ncbi:MAG: sulfur carrier protein ThiS [Bacteroides sp.]|nr:sulfur carrier protein ThiS [Roseburia sp.]MCM1345514.1 sulfur carrier protein ThiS [Bacteroides sp.]MCM1420023.1 sulfur carrier protein ThiS [Bacteroides sp.]
MNVKVNGKEVNVQGTTLTDLIVQLALPQNGVAVAVENKMIPRIKWNDYTLDEGLQIVIIKAACGG